MKAYNILRSTTILFLLLATAHSQNAIKITTWNMEHLGSQGRGLGGIGSGNLGFRTDEQIESIADLIKDTLKSDILNIQEVAITDIVHDVKINDKLELLISHMGDSWNYLIGSPGDEITIGAEYHNMQNAFIWNSEKVRLINSFDIEMPNIYIGERAFDRLPFAGYFEAIDANSPNRTDFLLVNVHLKSGQDNDENHLATMVIIEQNLHLFLKKNSVKESDVAILGDFNDNPFDERYFDFLYQYMEYKKYTDLVKKNTGATRMDNNLTSIIDHILVNKSMQLEMPDLNIEKYMPAEDHNTLSTWRKTYSDHFPLSFYIKVRSDNDVD